MLMFFFQMLLFSLTARGDGFPVGFENPMGLGDGQKFNPHMLMGTGTGLRFSRGDGFGQAKPGGFRPRCHLEFLSLL